MSAELVELPRKTLMDVPRVLRSIADQIEVGEFGEVLSAVVVIESDRIHTFGAGLADFHRALGLLFRGQLHMAKEPE